MHRPRGAKGAAAAASSRPAAGRSRSLRIRGVSYPVILPSWRDPRLHVAATFVLLHTIGQVGFHFRVSFPQILTALLTAGLLELGITFWRKRTIIWPASALLTGNGIAFILRVPGTRHGDWWSTKGLWIYAAVAAVSLLSKYLVQFRGRHVFNPSNLGLVLFFLILGSRRTEPLEFWWGPMSPWLGLALGAIVCGALVALSRVNLLAVAAGFWLTFAAGIGVLAASGHAMSANWHVGPVSDDYFWKVLITSPEVFVFLSFMITDPKTVPVGRTARRVYAISIGILAVLLIAPQRTEFAAKVGLLAALTLVCAARPVVILGGEALARRRVGAASHRLLTRAARAGAAVFAAAGLAALIAVAGAPARSNAGIDRGAMQQLSAQVTVEPTPRIAAISEQTAHKIAFDVVSDLKSATDALRRRNATQAAEGAGGDWLVTLQEQISASRGKSIDVPAYDVKRVRIKLHPGIGQGAPIVVTSLAGTVKQRGAARPFTRSFEVALAGGRFVIVRDHELKPKAAPAAVSQSVAASRSKGTAAFARVQLKDVAKPVGLDFRQGAFRFGVSADAPAMMGGGLCWLDYNNDGWLDLFVVNSYADQDVGLWDKHGGLPRSALFRNVHGKFVNVSRGSRANIQTRGNGCVAADFNGDGYTDLYVTSAVDDQLLWNNGNGTFTEGARSSGVVSFGWHAGAAVADVNRDGRPDLFVAGYTDVNAPILDSMAGFPTNHHGVRDLLFLNEGNDRSGHARFKEVGVQAGLESAHFRHGLGASFTDVNGDGRPDLYVANDADPNDLYINEPMRGGLGFRLVERARAVGVADPHAGMGVASADYNGDGLPDLFITNSRGQPHAVYASTSPVSGNPGFLAVRSEFAAALQRRQTVGWGDSWVDLNNDGALDLIVTNGAIPVTNLKRDTEPIQVLESLGTPGTKGKFVNASGVIDSHNLPAIIGRGLAAADFNNDGRVDIAINTISGPLVLLENARATGHWLEVSLAGFHPGALVTATLPDGRKLVQEVHAGSSYLSSEDPRVHFGLGKETTVSRLVVRYPDGSTTSLKNVAADEIVKLAQS